MARINITKNGALYSAYYISTEHALRSATIKRSAKSPKTNSLNI